MPEHKVVLTILQKVALGKHYSQAMESPSLLKKYLHKVREINYNFLKSVRYTVLFALSTIWIGKLNF